jgi:hypothetical protein
MIVFALMAAACSGGDSVDTTSSSPATTTAPTTTAATTTVAPTVTSTTTAAPTETTTPTEPPTSGPPPLVVTSVDFEEEWVEITNVSGSDYSLDGHFVCNFPTYISIGDLGTIAAGESFTIELADLAASQSTGEVGVYTSNDFANPDAMVTYVEWGTPDHGRSDVAVAAGLWTDGDFVDNGHASFRALTNGGSGDDYELVE